MKRPLDILLPMIKAAAAGTFKLSEAETKATLGEVAYWLEKLQAIDKSIDDSEEFSPDLLDGSPVEERVRGVLEGHHMVAEALEKHLLSDADDGDETYQDAMVRCIERVAGDLRRLRILLGWSNGTLPASEAEVMLGVKRGELFELERDEMAELKRVREQLEASNAS